MGRPTYGLLCLLDLAYYLRAYIPIILGQINPNFPLVTGDTLPIRLWNTILIPLTLLTLPISSSSYLF